MTDRIDVVFIENETELLWPIRLSMVYDENKTGQQRDQSYKFDLGWNRNWTVGTYLTRCNMWWTPDETTT